MNNKKYKNIIIYIYHQYVQDELLAASAQMSYYLILAFIPFIIFILTIVSNTKIPEQEIFTYLAMILPEQTFLLIDTIIREVMSSNPGNIFYIILTVYFSSMGARAIMVNINKAYNEIESRSILKLWGMSFVFTIVFAMLLVLSLIAMVFGQLIGQELFAFLKIPFEFRLLWGYLRYVFTIAIMIIIFIYIYYSAPNCKLKIKDVFWGSVFSTLSWTLLSMVFAFYVGNFSNYNKIYGSLGGIFILLVWLYLSSNIILLGGEINAYFYNKKYNRYY